METIGRRYGRGPKTFYTTEESKAMATDENILFFEV